MWHISSISRTASIALLSVSISLAPLTGTKTAFGTVLNFDDLSAPYILSGSGYADLFWETGTGGIGSGPGSWGAIFGSFPYSPPISVVNGGGCTLIGIGFPSLVDMSGAYVAVQGNA